MDRIDSVTSRPSSSVSWVGIFSIVAALVPPVLLLIGPYIFWPLILLWFAAPYILCPLEAGAFVMGYLAKDSWVGKIGMVLSGLIFLIMIAARIYFQFRQYFP